MLSPRNCAFAPPNAGEPFSHFGSFKGYSRPTEKQIDEFWSLNASGLNSKRGTMDQQALD